MTFGSLISSGIGILSGRGWPRAVAIGSPSFLTRLCFLVRKRSGFCPRTLAAQRFTPPQTDGILGPPRVGLGVSLDYLFYNDDYVRNLSPEDEKILKKAAEALQRAYGQKK